MNRTARVTIQFKCSGDSDQIIRKHLADYDGGMSSTRATELGVSSYTIDKVLAVRLCKISKRKKKPLNTIKSKVKHEA